MSKIRLFRNNAAIDATIFTKDRVVEGVTRYSGKKLEEIAFIGDEIVDLPIIRTCGLGLVGAPSNAQERVIQEVKRLPHGYVSEKRVFDGFVEFYKVAQQRGIKLVLSDRDGVLKEGSDNSRGDDFREILSHMDGELYPYVAVLTGSGYEQNISFRKKYGLDERLKENSFVIKYPYLLLLENGAIHLNILTGEIKNYLSEIQPELLNILKGEFEQRIRDKMEKEILQKFRLSWSTYYEDQKGKIYHAPKLSMVTFNVPRTFHDGKPYRESVEADNFRDSVLQIMENTAQELGLNYEIM